jgi:hypothetical protein
MSNVVRHHPAEEPTEDGRAPLELQPTHERELSSDARRFLHDLHVAERQLNAAFSVGREGGGLEQRIRRVYREMFGTD